MRYFRVVILLVLMGAGIVILPAQEIPSEFSFQYWDGKYLIAHGLDGSPEGPIVATYDRNGHLQQEGFVWFDGARHVLVTGAAISKTGSAESIIVSGSTINKRGTVADFIAALDEHGKVAQVIRTSPFAPFHICSAEDGTVWSLGYDRHNQAAGAGSYPTLRQFSFSKGMLRALLDTSTINANPFQIQGRYPGDVNLQCGSSVVGVYLGPVGQWVEFNSRNNTLKRWSFAVLPREVMITGAAMTSSGGVYASLLDRTSGDPQKYSSGIFRLELDSSSSVARWKAIPSTAGPFTELIGTTGTELAYRKEEGSTKLYWLKPLN